MDPVTFLNGLQDGIESSVVALGASPWLLIVVVAFCFVDGFFPPVPSESIVIAAAALSVAGAISAAYMVLLVAAAALGAWGGDLVAHAIGARMRLERLRSFRGERGSAALTKARALLDRRGSTAILSGRFIPVARVAVNMTAGAVGYPRARFVPLAAGASVLWALYAAGVGIGAGHLLRDDPVLAMVLGIAVGVLIGLGVDAVIGRLRVVRAPRTADAP